MYLKEVRADMDRDTHQRMFTEASALKPKRKRKRARIFISRERTAVLLSARILRAVTNHALKYSLIWGSVKKWSK